MMETIFGGKFGSKTTFGIFLKFYMMAVLDGSSGFLRKVPVMPKMG